MPAFHESAPAGTCFDARQQMNTRSSTRRIRASYIKLDRAEGVGERIRARGEETHPGFGVE